ncbi:MAG: DUF6922 domain-containing protein [Bacteroidia bacterium]|jgi:hypothetical protein
MTKPLKPNLNPRIFWDVRFDDLDYEKYANFIIERVFERGDVEDIRQTRRFYGDDRVKLALTQAKWLGESTLTLAQALFDNDKNAYRCYILRQSNPGLFSY